MYIYRQASDGVVAEGGAAVAGSRRRAVGQHPPRQARQPLRILYIIFVIL